MGKFGQCPDCGANSGQVLLTGIWCKAHADVHLYGAAPVKIERTDVKAMAEENDLKKKLDKWFKDQVKQVPVKCENCNNPIGTFPKGMTMKAAVCHILPKGTCESVATHPQNRWFGCWQCHTDFDNALPAEQAQMPVATICRERFAHFNDAVATNQRRKIPDWLLPDEEKPTASIPKTNSKAKKK